jgi:hypothetical protein
MAAAGGREPGRPDRWSGAAAGIRTGSNGGTPPHHGHGRDIHPRRREGVGAVDATRWSLWVEGPASVEGEPTHPSRKEREMKIQEL